MNSLKDFSLKDNRVCFYVDNIGILGNIKQIIGDYYIDGFVFQTHGNHVILVEGNCIVTSIEKRIIEQMSKNLNDKFYKCMYIAIKELISKTDHIVRRIEIGGSSCEHLRLFPSNTIHNWKSPDNQLFVTIYKDGIYIPKIHEFNRITFDIVMNKYDITPQQKWMTQEEHQTQDLMRNLFPTLL